MKIISVEKAGIVQRFATGINFRSGQIYFMYLQPKPKTQKEHMMAFQHEIISKNGTKVVNLTPLRAIREKCLDCTCWQLREVKLCTIKDCALYPYRLGVDPCRTGKGSSGNLIKGHFTKKIPTQVGVLSRKKSNPIDAMAAAILN